MFAFFSLLPLLVASKSIVDGSEDIGGALYQAPHSHSKPNTYMSSPILKQKNLTILQWNASSNANARTKVDQGDDHMMNIHKFTSLATGFGQQQFSALIDGSPKGKDQIRVNSLCCINETHLGMNIPNISAKGNLRSTQNAYYGIWTVVDALYLYLIAGYKQDLLHRYQVWRIDTLNCEGENWNLLLDQEMPELDGPSNDGLPGSGRILNVLKSVDKKSKGIQLIIGYPSNNAISSDDDGYANLRAATALIKTTGSPTLELRRSSEKFPHDTLYVDSVNLPQDFGFCYAFPMPASEGIRLHCPTLSDKAMSFFASATLPVKYHWQGVSATMTKGDDPHLIIFAIANGRVNDDGTIDEDSSGSSAIGIVTRRFDTQSGVFYPLGYDKILTDKDLIPLLKLVGTKIKLLNSHLNVDDVTNAVNLALTIRDAGGTYAHVYSNIFPKEFTTTPTFTAKGKAQVVGTKDGNSLGLSINENANFLAFSSSRKLKEGPLANYYSGVYQWGSDSCSCFCKKT